jgi:hypothetical protein
MAVMPKQSNDVVALAEQMINGLTEHAADFPSVSKTELVTALGDYKESRDAYEDKVSLVKLAQTARDNTLQSLLDVMKSDLKLAEVDAGADTDKLYEIGWGPRPRVLDVPGQVIDLHPIAEGNGMIYLQWSKPANGGPVGNYILERQQQPDGAQAGPWVMAGNAYDCECRLTGQPTNIRVGYHVKAVNASGEGTASSFVSVVLPQVN